MFTTIEQILRCSTLLVEFLKILCQDPFLFLIVINDTGFASIVNYHSHLLQMTPTTLYLSLNFKERYNVVNRNN